MVRSLRELSHGGFRRQWPFSCMYMWGYGCNITRGSLSNDGTNGYYWSASPNNTNNGYNLNFNSGNVNPQNNNNRANGFSVRPVSEYNSIIMLLTEYNKEKAYKETYELLLLTYRKVKNVAPDVMGKSLEELKRLLSGVLSRIYQMGMAFDKVGHIRRAKKDIDEVKSRFDVLHRTKSIDDELYEDVMKRADCIQDELDTLMETKKEILGTD